MEYQICIRINRIFASVIVLMDTPVKIVQLILMNAKKAEYVAMKITNVLTLLDRLNVIAHMIGQEKIEDRVVETHFNFFIRIS